MGKTQSRQAENTGAVVNTVEINEVHQAEVVNTELFVALYILVALSIIKLTIQMYKLWKNNLKRKYMRRAVSMDVV